MPNLKNTLIFPLLERIYKQYDTFKSEFVCDKKLEKNLKQKRLSVLLDRLVKQGYLKKKIDAQPENECRYVLLYGENLIANYIKAHFGLKDFFLKHYFSYGQKEKAEKNWAPAIQEYILILQQQLSSTEFNNAFMCLVLLWHLSTEENTSFVIETFVDLVFPRNINHRERASLSTRMSSVLNQHELSKFFNCKMGDNKRRYQLQTSDAFLFAVFDYNENLYQAYCERFQIDKLNIRETINPAVINKKATYKKIYQRRVEMKKRADPDSLGWGEHEEIIKSRKRKNDDKLSYYAKKRKPSSALPKNDLGFFKTAQSVTYDPNDSCDMEAFSVELTKQIQTLRQLPENQIYHYRPSLFDLTNSFKFQYCQKKERDKQSLPFSVIISKEINQDDIIMEYKCEEVCDAAVSTVLLQNEGFNCARFINYSSTQANVKLEIICEGADNQVIKKTMLIVALRNIKVGEVLYANFENQLLMEKSSISVGKNL